MLGIVKPKAPQPAILQQSNIAFLLSHPADVSLQRAPQLFETAAGIAA